MREAFGQAKLTSSTGDLHAVIQVSFELNEVCGKSIILYYIESLDIVARISEGRKWISYLSGAKFGCDK